MTHARKSHRQHPGELAVQRRRGVPAEVSEAIGGAIHDDMPHALVDYYRSLSFLPLGTLDDRGRPWVTLLSNPETSATTGERLQIRARVRVDDPFVGALRSPGSHPFAGVAIDLATRSRVKLAGVIDRATLDRPSETLTLELWTNEHMGNCPKYITVRRLRPARREPSMDALGAKLSSAAIALLARASTTFIATRHVDSDPHESDMGLNHRGGPPGFVRYFEDDRGAYLVIPDYSGNRFYQSLGNVETDPVMGVAVPDFTTGELLQLTGRARNLFDDEASAVMPGATLVTLVTVEDAVLTRGAIDLELVGPEELSPYNPLVRPLAREVPSDRTAVLAKAKLVDVTRETKRIKTFTFTLDEPVEIVPGGYVILDFSERMSRWYQHMNDRHPRSLNDDLVRTFTVSKVSADRRQLSITVKKSGVVSSYLHSLSVTREPLELTVKGVGGSFTCFENGRALPRMVWVAGGVGLTPFLAMVRALRSSGEPMPDIDLLYACRGDEVDLVSELGDLRVQIFDSTAKERKTEAARAIHPRRMTAADLLPIVDRATVFVCGPVGLMSDVASWLGGTIEPSRLRMERFDF